MRKTNEAVWCRSKKTGTWELLVTFNRHWEAPPVGKGLGKVLRVPVYRRGEYTPETKTLELTSRVFRWDGKLKAYAKEVA